MKSEERERIAKEAKQPPKAQPPLDSGSRVTPTPHDFKKVFAGKVRSTTDSADEADIQATRQLLESTQDGDTYYCPRCDFATVLPEDMIEHLAEEINKGLAAIASMHKPATPPQGE